jgi:hypothetical protein
MALQRIRKTSQYLNNLKERLSDCILFVRMEDSGQDCNEDSWLGSSVARELQALSTHTVHHFALIAVALRAHGVEVPPDFGYSPATLRFLKDAA